VETHERQDGGRNHGRSSALLGAFAVVGIAMALAWSAQSDSRAVSTKLRQVASREDVAMYPEALAGGGGWCFARISGEGCATLGRRVHRRPILLEEWTVINGPKTAVCVAICGRGHPLVFATFRRILSALVGARSDSRKAQP
jgi:hypothetical protein